MAFFKSSARIETSLSRMGMTREDLLTLIDRAADEGWKELDLSGQNLTELPAEIGKLTQLETLILGKWERNKEGPQGFRGFEIINYDLVPLTLGNALVSLPHELENLVNLRKLDLSGNLFNRIPDIVAKLRFLEHLVLFGKNLNEFSDSIAQLTHLKTLSLCSNQLTHIPEFVTQLTDLVQLVLYGNQITSIPDSIDQLTNLKVLDLSHNQLTYIPDSIAQLTSLKVFYLAYNQLTYIPDSVAQLTNLRIFDIADNQLANFPQAITQLTNLRLLYLSRNQLACIPESITQLTELRLLFLSGNQLTHIPESIAQLTHLKEFYLSNNRLTHIPESIAQLTRLRVLSLQDNQLTHIPESIAQLTRLRVLSLQDNQLTHIPESIAQLRHLKIIYFSSNRLTYILEPIIQLKSLTEVSFSDNQLTQIPESFAQLTNLRKVNLSNNHLTQIPESFAQLTNLIEVDLSNNHLTQIPESFAQLTNLIEVDLSNNQLTQIPESFAQLTNLRKVDLSRNQLVEIPMSIAQLVELTVLSFFSNRIAEIPDFLEKLPNLKRLDLRRNLLPISPEILGLPNEFQPPGCVKDILDYCRQLRSGEVRPLSEAKLLLIGQATVGKTSLINRLVHDKFDPYETQTDGLNVQTWMVHVNSKDVRLNVWDFGGQEIYHATHQFFLTKRSLYLLVCNCRTSEEENRLEYWLKLIESFGGQSPVIIVGNKKDEQPLDINQKALREKYPNIRHIIETSCQDNEGIDRLHQAITYEVGQLKEVYDLLPLSWFEVKEHLESMNTDCISYSQYACICASRNIIEEDNQVQLVGLLHNLGLVLSFRDHPILQNTNVLNPDWVTHGIYALLSDEILKTKTKGILTYSDLSRILDSQRYPSKRHCYLIELMKEFQLCFQLPNCLAPTFLIPGLLPKDEPTNVVLSGNILEFQYRYRILPESIISRFIVLTHDKIYNQIYWRSGVMLFYAEGEETYNVACIKADLEDKRIFISISGREATRRSFLCMIRNEFNKIHNSFSNLEVNEYVPVPGFPEHSPLDYRDLLGLEEMGETELPIGRLRIKVNLRQLLDGYESIESRQNRQKFEQKVGRGYMSEYSDLPGVVVINNWEANSMSQHSSYTNNFQNPNIGNFANEVKDNARQQANQYNYSLETRQTLAEAADEIQRLLKQLEVTNPTASEAEQVAYINIATKPDLKQRAIAALKEGGETAIEEFFLENKYLKVAKAVIKGWLLPNG